MKNLGLLRPFMRRPANLDCCTTVQCFHDYHPGYTLYFSVEDYQEKFMPVTASLWTNGYTFIIQPTTLLNGATQS